MPPTWWQVQNLPGLLVDDDRPRVRRLLSLCYAAVRGRRGGGRRRRQQPALATSDEGQPVLFVLMEGKPTPCSTDAHDGLSHGICEGTRYLIVSR